MRTYVHLAIVKQEDGKERLFSIPNREPIKSGTKVICDTARGERPGKLAIDSFVVDSRKALEAVMYLMPGATLPIKDIVGVVKEKKHTVEEITDFRTGVTTTTAYSMSEELPF